MTKNNSTNKLNHIACLDLVNFCGLSTHLNTGSKINWWKLLHAFLSRNQVAIWSARDITLGQANIGMRHILTNFSQPWALKGGRLLLPTILCNRDVSSLMSTSRLATSSPNLTEGSQHNTTCTQLSKPPPLYVHS